MIKNVGFNQNTQIPQNLAFKSKQEYSPVTSPIENPNLSGADALASYNSAFIKNQNKFDIPLVKPLQIPSDPNAIEGESVYNSKGVLECIVKETKDKKYVYTNDNNNSSKINNLRIYDKKTGNKVFEQNEFGCIDDKGDHKWWEVRVYDSVTGQETNSTMYNEWGEPTSKEVLIYNSDGSCDFLVYNYVDKEYSKYNVINSSQKTHYYKTYDVNGNMKSEFYSECKEDGLYTKELKYENGREVSKEINKKQAIDNPEYHKYLQNPEMKPTECPEFITSIDNIEGEKTYYSNGQIESVKTSDGKLYEVSLDGNHITLYDGNKTIEFSQNKGCNGKYCTIHEDFDGVSKMTSYSGENGDELALVSYIKGNVEKNISYKKGKPECYNEFLRQNDDFTNIISVEFAPNGGVLNVYKDRQLGQSL